ncbi:hypothetical protein H7284_15890 [Klebsiella pneumoniae]|nr:hypothetical protein [Klebsiella pneumoniae]
MMNPVPWLQMTNMISYQGLVRTFLSIKDIKQRYASNSDGMKKLQGFMKRNSVSTLIQSAFGIAVSILLLLQISSPA